MRKTQEMHIRSLGQEDPLEKERATTPVLLPGKSHGKRNQAGSAYGILKSRKALKTQLSN